MLKDLSCAICEGKCFPLDVVDFNKSCVEPKGVYLRLSGVPIYYYICENCGFCFAPEFSTWTLKSFEEKIYNDDYIKVDPDYKEARPRANAESLQLLFREKQAQIRHLDFGGGEGYLSHLLRGAQWDSLSHDPFVNKEADIKSLGKFDLITAYEVFEHVPDVNDLMLHLDILLKEDGVVLFSTLLSDGQITTHQRLSWWYASPRNGHISLFSSASLSILAQKHGFNSGSFSNGFHAFFRKKAPSWASHLFV